MQQVHSSWLNYATNELQYKVQISRYLILLTDHCQLHSQDRKKICIISAVAILILRVKFENFGLTCSFGKI